MTDTNDTQVLESGDDLAQKALAEANQEALPAPAAAALPNGGASGEALAATLTSLQRVIERNVNQLDELKAKLKEYRESLKGIFENDQGLAEAEVLATEVTQKVKERKVQLQGSAMAIQLKNQISEVNEQKKEIEEALNNHLLNLFQVTGTKTFDTSSGEQREFTIRASVKGGKRSDDSSN